MGDSMNILIVDDIRENLYMLEAVLKGYGYKVRSASDGVEALELASEEDFDMIISDILMPRMDGFQLCRAVKSDSRLKKTAFVFYTATYTDSADEEFALSLGAERFILKPIEPERFIGILREVIREHENGRLKAPRTPIDDEKVYLKEYNERLVRKLEDKMIELERINKGLKESEEKYRDLIENANDAVLVFDVDGNITFANPKFTEMTGYSLSEAKGMHFSRLIHPGDLEMCSEYFRKRQAGEKVPRNYEFRIVTNSGEILQVDNNVSTIRKEGRIVGILKIMRDVSERKRVEDEKRRIEAQLLQSQKMEAIGTLAGGVAHDFNNMLTTIQGYTELAMTTLDEADPVYQNLKQVHHAAIRAADLTRQLLLFSRKQPMELVPLNINRTIDNLLKMLKRLIGEDIAIHTDLETGIWTIRADGGKIEQVLMNLAVNARDAMPDGGKITFKTENVWIGSDYCSDYPFARPGKFVCLTVQDTGIGMDEEMCKHIFEPFFTTKEATGGTGLGLAVVYGIIKQHEGWINVYSSPGQGSTFKIYIPAIASKAEEKKELKESLDEFRGSGERILLVEDEEIIRKLTRMVLVDKGYEVFVAGSANEAISVFERENGEFHLVFCDVVLPDRSGLRLVDELLGRRPSLKVLLSSGYTNHKSQWPIIREKKFSYLQKPYALTELLRAVREAIDS
jgi:PAS domain S-box-containing protein